MSSNDWRVIALRALTGQFLTWDLDLSDSVNVRELSGPGGISGTVGRELARVLGDDGHPLLEEWSTALLLEEDGQIRGGGIIQTLTPDGGRLEVNAPGFTSYPMGVPVTTDYIPVDFEDPVTIYTNLWAHLQAFPDGDLGVTVNPPSTSTYSIVSGGSGPYQILGPEYRDYGEQMTQLANAAPFEYLERTTWNGDRTGVVRTVDLGFPRMGRRRFDLRFAQDENIVAFSPIGADGDRFSNEVHILGMSGNPDMPSAVNAVRDGRLRRPKVITRKADSQWLVDLYAGQERRARELTIDIASVTIKDHPNARISTIDPGDDIRVDVDVPWYGDLSIWVRVLSIEEAVDDPGRATLKTQRSDAFTYPAETNPGTEPAIITL